MARPYRNFFERFYRLFGPSSRRVSPEEDERKADVAAHLEEAGCVVLQGPPGAGKTYEAERFIEYLALQTLGPGASMGSTAGAASRAARAAACQWSRLAEPVRREAAYGDGALPAELHELPLIWDIVQLHPGYAYEDFVRGLVTDAGGSNSEDPGRASGGIRFSPKDRILVELAQVAARFNESSSTGGARPKPVVLILDEINRANLAAVLGEAILLLEKSKRAGRRCGCSTRRPWAGATRCRSPTTSGSSAR
jgi:5-methylcytosine-specific restriction protein B